LICSQAIANFLDNVQLNNGVEEIFYVFWTRSQEESQRISKKNLESAHEGIAPLFRQAAIGCHSG
jgi:hypothetical protein